MSIHVAVGLVPVKRFDHESLHQLQNSFVTDEDLRCRNILLEPDLQLRECSSTLHKSARQRSMRLYHIISPIRDKYETQIRLAAQFTNLLAAMRILLLQHCLQKTSPQLLQWCLRFSTVKTALQLEQSTTLRVQEGGEDVEGWSKEVKDKEREEVG